MTGHGRLRVFLGAAPGVGTSYAMLTEGKRLLRTGRDVVLAALETHGRDATAAMAEGIEVVPPRDPTRPGEAELDLNAVLARRPDVALVDNLAHRNVSGVLPEQRWQDVQHLLSAGIDVVSTIDIRSVESLREIVELIYEAGTDEAGTDQSVPDEVLRAADRVEFVDLSPEALRERIAEGRIFPAELIEAELSGLFRIETLRSLRELALLWLAGEVDHSLREYHLDERRPGGREMRERVVVSLSGGPEGETLLQRGARIAERFAGGELHAVHVTSQKGSREADPVALTRQRALLEALGGSYHQVTGDDIPTALLEVAASVNATQLIIGASRRSPLAAALTGPGIGATVVREAGHLDVHVVHHQAAASGRLALPRLDGPVTWKRRVAGIVFALAVGTLLTWLLAISRSTDSLTREMLSYQLLIVICAVIGGIWPALVTAGLSGLALAYFFIEPFYALVPFTDAQHLLTLILYVIAAILLGLIVSRATRQARAAWRATAESELLATVAGSVLRGEEALQALVERAREAFRLDCVRLVDGDTVLASSGESLPDDRCTILPVGERAALELHGAPLDASERRLLAVVIAQLAAALDHSDLAAVDKIRSALLSALGHDLRRPVAAATAAVSGLRAARGSLDDEDSEELLITAEESLSTLASLIIDLLDASRLQAGALAIHLAPVAPAKVIVPALRELDLGRDRIDVDFDPALPPVLADPALLRRVMVNLLANAARHAPQGTKVRVTTSVAGDTAEIRVIDQGPGIPKDRRETVFLPFQREGDTDNASGLGLGLALSKGFVEGMGGTLIPEDTPGGGLTMVVAIPLTGASRHDVASPAPERMPVPRRMDI